MSIGLRISIYCGLRTSRSKPGQKITARHRQRVNSSSSELLLDPSRGSTHLFPPQREVISAKNLSVACTNSPFTFAPFPLGPNASVRGAWSILNCQYQCFTPQRPGLGGGSSATTARAGSGEQRCAGLRAPGAQRGEDAVRASALCSGASVPLSLGLRRGLSSVSSSGLTR